MRAQHVGSSLEVLHEITRSSMSTTNVLHDTTRLSMDTTKVFQWFLLTSAIMDHSRASLMGPVEAPHGSQPIHSGQFLKVMGGYWFNPCPIGISDPNLYLWPFYLFRLSILAHLGKSIYNINYSLDCQCIT